MLNERFQLALERIGPSDWKAFEEFATAFLVSEYTNLRATASQGGDGGRDAELFSPDGMPKTFFQFSVAEDWKNKIKSTAKRLKETNRTGSLLIYVTNKEIGANADKLKPLLRSDYDITLDIFDNSWFLSRANTDDNRHTAFKKLAISFVDPLLSDRGIITDESRAVTSDEFRAAHLYLSLQLEDDAQNKGLTKLSYEALIKSVLRETNPKNVLPKEKIIESIKIILSSHLPAIVDRNTNNSLKRLSDRQIIRHHTNVDSYCLSYEETKKLALEIAIHDRDHKLLKEKIGHFLTETSSNDSFIETNRDILIIRVERIVELFLYNRGEKFANAISTGTIPGLAIYDLRKIIDEDLRNDVIPKAPKQLISHLNNAITRVLQSQDEHIIKYIRSISNGYTIMAFLRETPDTQSSVKKLFSPLEVFLDTGIILPILAEVSPSGNNGNNDNKPYTNMIKAATESGVKLFVIPGILEEIAGHIARCIACTTIGADRWQGNVPFLLAQYISNGYSIDSFSHWTDEFRGNLRPEEDLGDYLKEYFDISTISLEKEVEDHSITIRGAVQEIWHEAHERRRSNRVFPIDDMIVHRLINHDVENYLGIIKRRKKDNNLALGYSSWWLTLDSAAYRVEGELRKRILSTIEASPVISLDFFANYLTFGPLRDAGVGKKHSVPVFMDRIFSEFIPPELIAVATKVRVDSASLSELAIRRRVRDALDRERAKLEISSQGWLSLTKEDEEINPDTIALDV